LRDRLGAAKPGAQAPQSDWHGFDKTVADMPVSAELFEPGSVVWLGAIDESSLVASMVGTASISEPPTLAVTPANALE
jgi:hypothetical protein